jgi:hypothetical protein
MIFINYFGMADEGREEFGKEHIAQISVFVQLNFFLELIIPIRVWHAQINGVRIL